MELSTHEIKTHKTLAALAALCCLLLLTLFLLVYRVMARNEAVPASSSSVNLSIALGQDEPISAQVSAQQNEQSSNTSAEAASLPAETAAPVQTAEHSDAAHMTQSYLLHRGNQTGILPGEVEIPEPGGPAGTEAVRFPAADGFGVALSGRRVTHQPAFTSEANEQGTVVVDITVNAKGQVIEAEPGARGTTTGSAALRRRSRELAFATTFNAVSGQAEQRGTITIVYTFNK